MSLERYLFEFCFFAGLTDSYRLNPDNLESIVNKLGLSILKVNSSFMKEKFSEFGWTFEPDYYVLDFEQFTASVTSPSSSSSPAAQQSLGVSGCRQSVFPRERAPFLPRFHLRAGPPRRPQALRLPAVPLRRSPLRLLPLPDDQPRGIPQFPSRAVSRRRAHPHLGSVRRVDPRGFFLWSA